jgi:hypothetical protein
MLRLFEVILHVVLRQRHPVFGQKSDALRDQGRVIRHFARGQPKPLMPVWAAMCGHISGIKTPSMSMHATCLRDGVAGCVVVQHITER